MEAFFTAYQHTLSRPAGSVGHRCRCGHIAHACHIYIARGSHPLKAQADIALMVTEEARERNASSSALLTANTSARG
jgi:hypothetical protein